jgi:adenosylmethionine-8-amino-7-oxononanoate aminotransferase
MEKKKGRVFSIGYGANLPVLVRGEGIYVYDENGKEYIDTCAGIAVVSLGHGRLDVAEALSAQAKELAYCAPHHFENRVSRELAEELGKFTPGDLNYFFFTSGGSECNESIMKIARLYFLAKGLPDKHLFISRQLSFHGATLGALSLCGVKERTDTYEPLLLHFPKIPPPYCYRCPFDSSYPSCGVACARSLERAIVDAGPEKVAGFFAEPVSLTIGPMVPPKEYFHIICDICKKYEVLFIADEVITGFGRLGRNFGIEHWEAVPDMMSCAKGIASGYAPLGVCMISEKINSVFQEKDVVLNHLLTFSNNPLAARAGLTVQQIFKRERIVEHSAAVGKLFQEEAQKLYENPIVGDIRGLGLVLGVELVEDRKTKKAFSAEKGVVRLIGQACRDEGIMPYTGRAEFNGSFIDFFQIFPPLVIKKDEVLDVLHRIDRAIKKVQRTLFVDS